MPPRLVDLLEDTPLGNPDASAILTGFRRLPCCRIRSVGRREAEIVSPKAMAFVGKLLEVGRGSGKMGLGFEQTSKASRMELGNSPAWPPSRRGPRLSTYISIPPNGAK